LLIVDTQRIFISFDYSSKMIMSSYQAFSPLKKSRRKPMTV